MRLAHTLQELNAGAAPRVLVPTMGALHEGHLSLIRLAREHARHDEAQVVVTIFINPTQFNDPADFDRYPRALDEDAALAQSAGADVVYAPSADDVYPPGETIPKPTLPPQANAGLEDAHRPGHFEGVCQVVARLFRMTRPRAAVFGEKDWQQLQVIRAMTNQETDLRAIEILPAPTIREPDGLAMSSRNRLLSQEDRARAAAIPRALEDARAARTPSEAERAMRAELEKADLDIDYATIRRAETLEPITDEQFERRAPTALRALIAARLTPHDSPIRLLDNAPWG